MLRRILATWELESSWSLYVPTSEFVQRWSMPSGRALLVEKLDPRACSRASVSFADNPDDSEAERISIREGDRFFGAFSHLWLRVLPNVIRPNDPAWMTEAPFAVLTVATDPCELPERADSPGRCDLARVATGIGDLIHALSFGAPTVGMSSLTISADPGNVGNLWVGGAGYAFGYQPRWVCAPGATVHYTFPHRVLLGNGFVTPSLAYQAALSVTTTGPLDTWEISATYLPRLET